MGINGEFEPTPTWGVRTVGRMGRTAAYDIDDSKHDVYYRRMIKSFKCRETEKIFRREFSRRFPRDIQQRAFMRLNQIDSAVALEELRLPSSNRLEPLTGNRKGQHSIRINIQWRICFVWQGDGAADVEITDYH